MPVLSLEVTEVNMLCKSKVKLLFLVRCTHRLAIHQPLERTLCEPFTIWWNGRGSKASPGIEPLPTLDIVGRGIVSKQYSSCKKDRPHVWTRTELLVVRKHNNAIVIIHLRLHINEIDVLYQSRRLLRK